MMRVLEQAVAKIQGLPEERQRAAAEALETIAAQSTCREPQPTGRGLAMACLCNMEARRADN